MDVCASDWDCTLEPGRNGEGPGGEPSLRLGLRMAKGLSRQGAERLVRARTEAPRLTVRDLAQRAGLDRGDLLALAGADALRGLAGNRHQAAWQVTGIPEPLPLLTSRDDGESLPLLPPPGEGDSIVADYASLGLTLRRHPLALLRGHLQRRKLLCARQVNRMPPGRVVGTAGLVVNRQRPASANNVTFLTLEDETGYVNLVIWKRVANRQRKALLAARLLGVVGEIQRESGVTHLVARQLQDYSDLIGALATRTRDFR